MARFENGMRPVHPGEILREEYLVPLDMSANALALALRVTPARINEIVREQRGITPDTALRLARYFGGDARSWMNLQVSYDLKVAQRDHGERIAAEVVPREGMDHELPSA
ncbi:HigA family addiction module antitoxin [Cupriavidus taiwanensis]|uniref:Virulence factor n=1 Tax=Cupriavidus taiwanensis TaxID=164546 RepID=A0A375CBK9_9BURK|nr:Virulence factor [Cupriavidus taiwanensis]